MFKLMSTRYSNYGINTISDVEIFMARIHVKNEKKQIYHLRLDYNEYTSAFDTIRFFRNIVLPIIDSPFVCIITGEDLTIPNQVDVRWQEPWQLELMKGVYDDLIKNPFLIHCYIENRDTIHEKTSSIPLGMNPNEMPNRNIDYILKYMYNHNYKPICARELKTISIQRPRNGDRELINVLNKVYWKKHIIDSGKYSKDTWWELLQTYPFIICAHGGGIDPCPKVWEALCVGCIPIIKHSTLDDVYSEFPVVFVDNWNESTISVKNMQEWIETYSKYYDDPELRNKWIHKLFLQYWKDKITSHSRA